MTRQLKHLSLDRLICAGLREAIRPLDPTEYPPSTMINFCQSLYLSYYSLEEDPDKPDISYEPSFDELMIINHFVSSEDGAWAKEILHQTRQVLFERETGREAVQLVSTKNHLLDDIDISLDDEK